MVAVTNTVWNPWSSGFATRFFSGARNLRMSGPKPRSNIVSASSKTCSKEHHLTKAKKFREKWSSFDYKISNASVLFPATHQIFDVPINHVPLFNMLQNPPRCSNNHINRHAQGIFLGSQPAAPAYHGGPKSCMMAYGLSNPKDLKSHYLSSKTLKTYNFLKPELSGKNKKGPARIAPG